MSSPAGTAVRFPRRATIGAMVLLLAAITFGQSASADPGGHDGTPGPPSGTVPPGHAQDPPGRRAHGTPHAGSQVTSQVRNGQGPSSQSRGRHLGRHANHSSALGNALSTPPQNGHHKTTICHATGSATNPYVEISIPPPAVRAHSRHQDGRDIIPAPAGGCPGAATAQAGSQAPSATAQTTPAALVQQTATTLAAALPLATGGTARQGVLGVEASSRGGTRPARLAAAKPAASRSGGSDLPFTGFELAMAAALGIALLLVGVALKRAAGLRRAGASA